MKAKTFFLASMLTLILVAAPKGEGQGATKTESVSADSVQRASAQETEPIRQDTAKNLISNMRATLQKMKEQEEILKELVSGQPAQRAASLKVKGVEGESQAREAKEVKEGGESSAIHKLPQRIKTEAKADEAKSVASGETPSTHRDAASRTYCQNNLKQLSLDLDKDADKLHRLSRGTKKKSFLMEVERLQAKARRVGEAAKLIGVKPDPAADQKAMDALSAAVHGVETQLESVSLNYKAIK